jgi:predicted CXXCH cytochrome family protein
MRFIVRVTLLANVCVLGWAQAPEAGAKACLECHTGSAQSKRGSTEVDPARFELTPHAAVLSCAGCHAEGFGEYPHKGKKADAPDCSVCHSTDDSKPYNRAQIQADFQKSVHVTSTKIQRLGGQFKCTTCHDPHTFRPVNKFATVQEAIEDGNRVCLECHASTQETTELSMARLAAKHTWVPGWELHTRSARCVDCHTPGKAETIHQILPASQAQRDCVACHSRDSILMTKLYKHTAAQARTQNGFANAIMFNQAYMIGATKFEPFDRALPWVFGGVAGVLALHAVGRMLGRRAAPAKKEDAA